MRRRKHGTIIKEIGAFTNTHEQMTAEFLAAMGYDILFLAPNRVKGTKTPDIRMDGKLWEIKCPDHKCISETENRFKVLKRVKHILIITKDQQVIRLER